MPSDPWPDAHAGLGPDEELLDTRPDRPRRPWLAAVLAVGLAAVAGVAIVRAGHDSRPRADVPSSSPTPTTAVTPVVPAITSPPYADTTRVPGQCPHTAGCHRAATRPGTAAVVTAAIRDALGRTTKIRIRQRSVSGDRIPALLYSRVITATVPSGDLTLVVSAATADATVDLIPSGTDPAAATFFDHSVVQRYYTSAVLVTVRSRARPNVLTVRLHRLVNDPRLIAAHS